jgi:hypothetical protein
MTQSTVRPRIDQALDVQRNFLPKIALNTVFALDDFSEFDDLVFTEIFHADRPIDSRRFENMLRGRSSDPINIGQPDINPFPSRQINARDTCHLFSLQSTSSSPDRLQYARYRPLPDTNSTNGIFILAVAYGVDSHRAPARLPASARPCILHKSA